MKKEWVRPQTLIESFAANEYIAACGDSGKVYNFTCDAPGGILYYYPKSDGNIDGTYKGTGDKQIIGQYTPCDKKHEASSTDDFYDGFVRRIELVGEHAEIRDDPVIVWCGENGRNGHATKNLDMTTWETAKS